MNIAEWIMILLVLWTLAGIIGTAVAFRRREQTRARRSAATILVVWSIYLAVLFIVSRLQPSRAIAPGQDRCFDEMCFAVISAEDLEGFRTRTNTPERLLRVHIRVSNHGKARTQAEAAIHTRLLDERGRRWAEVPGLSGVPLTIRVPAGASTESSPVFRLPHDSAPVGIILSHGLSPARLVIGDAESLGHQPDIFLLPMARSSSSPNSALRQLQLPSLTAVEAFR